jgi:hypothetical protein
MNTQDQSLAIDDNVSEPGAAIYAHRIRPIERNHLGEYVAIHVDSGDFAIARTAGAVAREPRKAHAPDGRAYLREVGDEPEYMLAARLFGAAAASGQTK